MISPHQHGFLFKLSTCTQLLETIYDWPLSLRNRHVVDVVYFDFCKAFDSVSHVKLSQKLSGLSGPLFSFLTDFLNDRYQKVVFRYGSSSFIPVTSGVPQESVLSSVLFLIYINDISDKFCSNVTLSLFADDIKIYMELTFDDSDRELQNGIDCIVHWSSTWQLN